MKGVIIGDVIGSVYERNNIKTKDFPLFSEAKGFSSGSRYTDDSYLTIAVANAFLNLDEEHLKQDETVIRAVRDSFIEAGFGGIENWFGKGYRAWVKSEDHEPYGAFSNGAIMRCSPAAWAATSVEDAYRLGGLTAMPTHSHPQAVQAAGLVCEAIYMLNHGAGKEEVRALFEEYYTLPVIDEIRPVYKFDITCDGTLPVAVSAFLESTDFEDAIRTAVSVGGDSDTIADVSGVLAEAYYGIPEEIWEETKKRLPAEMIETINRFSARFK